MTFNNKTYDILKWIAQYFLPASGALYFALAKLWNLPYGTEVVGTISAVDVFLGALLGISSANYQGDGVMKLDTSAEEKDIYTLELNRPPEELANMKTITFRVDNGK